LIMKTSLFPNLIQQIVMFGKMLLLTLHSHSSIFNNKQQH
jgi:hypothetical protein